MGRRRCQARALCRLRPEITGASRKIISICLGRSEVGRQRLRPPSLRKRPRVPTADRAARPGTPAPTPGLNSTHPGQGARARGRRAAGGAGGGRVLPSGAWGAGRAVQSALRAIQASSWRRPRRRQPRECVEMTPPGRRRSPLLTLAGKWSSSSGTINGDRSLRADGVGEGRRGQASGHPGRGHQPHQQGDTVGHAGGQHPEPPLWAPRPQRSRLGPRSRNAPQQCLTRHGTAQPGQRNGWHGYTSNGVQTDTTTTNKPQHQDTTQGSPDPTRGSQPHNSSELRTLAAQQKSHKEDGIT